MAGDLLKKYNYNVEEALNHYYTHGGNASAGTVRSAPLCSAVLALLLPAQWVTDVSLLDVLYRSISQWW